MNFLECNVQKRSLLRVTTKKVVRKFRENWLPFDGGSTLRLAPAPFVSNNNSKKISRSFANCLSSGVTVVALALFRRFI